MDAQTLVNALIARGWTQKGIQERTGIPQPTVSKIARGKVDDVMSKSYIALLDLYKKDRRKKV